MKIEFDILNNEEYAQAMVNTPLKYEGKTIGRIISTGVNKNGRVTVQAKIYKKYVEFIKDKL